VRERDNGILNGRRESYKRKEEIILKMGGELRLKT